MVGRRISDMRFKIKASERCLNDTYLSTINSLAYAIEARDTYTRGHSERVTAYAVWLGTRIGMNKKRLSLLRHSCRLHDVGKIGVPDAILQKKGRLNLDERARIEQHPLYGVEILSELTFIKEGLPVILHHHERYDGRGYPYGLKKEKIPLEARIAALTDAFDAMTSARPYRSALPLAKVVEQIRENSGTQFDPYLAKAFLKILGESNPAVDLLSAIRIGTRGNTDRDIVVRKGSRS
jgi:HD-GYP domain-containing protein (c-di-GMP phosphodiesterase class II)